ncbi:hypothetical protein [Streptomyces sp. NPDC093089]
MEWSYWSSWSSWSYWSYCDKAKGYLAFDPGIVYYCMIPFRGA